MLLETFMNDTVAPQDFDHRAHVSVAYELLRRHDFATAHATYVTHLKALTQRAGVPEKFNASITFAAMSVVAERMHNADTPDDTLDETVDAFLTRNPDLLEARTLLRGYSKDRLTSPLARKIPLLPDLAIRRTQAPARH